MTDMRDILSLPEPDLSLLANVKDERQREMVKSTLESQDYRLLELSRRNRELQDQNRRLQSLEAVAKRARAEADKANEKCKAAEAARAEAESEAKLERFGRIEAERTRDELLDDLRSANESKSRIEHLPDKHDVEEHIE